MEEKQIKHWLKENWFKSVISFGVVIVSASAFYYFVILSHQKEARIAEQARTDLIEKNEKEAQILEQARLDLVEKNKLEEQKTAKEALAKQQKESWDNFVNKCMTDAYAELKTLQWNYDVITSKFCLKLQDIGTSCDTMNAKNGEDKDRAFVTYKEAWVPQCRLGNRVFIHYEPMKY